MTQRSLVVVELRWPASVVLACPRTSPLTRTLRFSAASVAIPIRLRGCGGAAWGGFNGFADKLTVGHLGCRHDVRLRAGDWPADEQESVQERRLEDVQQPVVQQPGPRVAYVNHHDGKGSDG